jgi:cytoskeletal protein CcmA (bactofilin family)
MAAAGTVGGAPPVVPGPAPPSLRERGVVRHESVRAGTWDAAGTIKVLKDAEAREAHLGGSVTVGGTFRAERLTSEGSFEVGGGVDVGGRFIARGGVRVGGPLRAGELSMRGRLHADGAITVARGLDASGGLRAPSITAATVRFDGNAEVTGAVRAPTTDLRLADGSHLGAVEGRSIRVAIVPPNLVRKILGPAPAAHVERIEADHVELEGVTVGLVRAPEVVLGRDAQVTVVEGTVVRRHPTSRVGPESRSPPPYGLRR